MYQEKVPKFIPIPGCFWDKDEKKEVKKEKREEIKRQKKEEKKQKKKQR